MGSRQRLHELKIVQPCSVPWDAMQGDDRTRFCDICAKRVYNFSAMDEREIVNCLRQNEEGVCAQIRRSRDGEIVTRQSAPKLRGLQFSLFSLLALLTTVATFLGFSSLIPLNRQADRDEWVEGAAEGGAVEGGAVEIPDDFLLGDVQMSPESLLDE